MGTTVQFFISVGRPITVEIRVVVWMFDSMTLGQVTW